MLYLAFYTDQEFAFCPNLGTYYFYLRYIKWYLDAGLCLSCRVILLVDLWLPSLHQFFFVCHHMRSR